MLKGGGQKKKDLVKKQTLNQPLSLFKAQMR
jgi:hypothetical protein